MAIGAGNMAAKINFAVQLLEAAKTGDKDTATKVLDDCPEEKLQDVVFAHDEGGSSFYYASKYGHHEIVQALLTKCPPDDLQTMLETDHDEDGTALDMAIEADNPALVEVLLAKGGEVLPAEKGYYNFIGPSLMVASRDGKKAIVEIILNKCPPHQRQNLIDRTDLPMNEGQTALELAKSNGHTEVA